MASDEGGSSDATTVLWLIVNPVIAVGAMVQARKTLSQYPYGAAVKVGLLTSLTGAAGLLLVWLLFAGVFDPNYLVDSVIAVGESAKASGENETMVQTRMSAALLIFSTPTFYLISFFIPLFSGCVASLIAAIGVKRKPTT